MTAGKAAAATLAGLALTLAMAWPVALAPSARIFGTEIDGRHHDSYTVMWQFEDAPPPLPYRQPLVDDVGRALATAMGAVAAFNAIVLISFPLTVLTTFALARYLRLPSGGAAIAAFAFAFAPPHLAHAAYHPHIAQTQWLPLYFLAVWASVDRFSAWRAALLLLAGAALALSNIYSAYIAAVLTPVAIAGAFIPARVDHPIHNPQRPARDPGQARNAARTMAVLVTTAAALLIALRAMMPALFSTTAGFAFPRADVARYGAQWFAYLLPPVDHPLWGGSAARVWADRGMTGALVEQQVSVSWALLALAAVALAGWWRARRTEGGEDRQALRAVPMLAALAAAAILCSLAPAPAASGLSQLLPASWLHNVAPMFRAYARFAFVAHLMVALLAGVGAMWLWRAAGASPARARARRTAAALLLVMAAVEYAPLPARAHDVLPTEAHRWVAAHGATGRVLDCAPGTLAGTYDAWLMGRDITPLPPALPSCFEQQAAARAATLGYRYAIVRRSSDAAPAPPGFILVRDLPSGAVYDIVAPAAPAVVARIEGFHRLERRGAETWRWMGAGGRWVLQVRSETVATLELELSAYGHARQIAVSLDGRRITALDTGAARSWHRVGPLAMTPGQHELTFAALEPPSTAPPPDRRMLSVRLHDWRWR